MSKVACLSCNSNVVPRLHFHGKRQDVLFHRQIEHICPICGKTLYVTGGGFTVIARLCIAAALITYGNFNGWPEWATQLAAIVITVGPLRVATGVGKLFSFFNNLSNKNI
jgi:ribose/xylose/arabinose/galactoside ABC-type transport system permease subunit